MEPAEKQEILERYEEARRLCRIGQHDNANAILVDLCERLPKNMNMQYARALCLAGAGRLDEARNLCDALVRNHGDTRAEHLLVRLDAVHIHKAPGRKRTLVGIWRRRLTPWLRESLKVVGGGVVGGLLALIAAYVVLRVDTSGLSFIARAVDSARAGIVSNVDGPDVAVGSVAVELNNQTATELTVRVEQRPYMTIAAGKAVQIQIMPGKRYFSALRLGGGGGDGIVDYLEIAGPSRVVFVDKPEGGVAARVEPLKAQQGP